MGNCKKIIIAALFMCCLTGCGNAKENETNTLTLREDGSIAHTIVESFEMNYYDEDELSAMASRKAEEYTDGTVSCESVQKKDGKVIVKMSYGTGEDYTGFNNREFYTGTVEEAGAKGYRFEDMVDKDGMSLTGDIGGAYSENHVLVVQTGAGEELAVSVYDNILCVSSNVTISGKKAAYIGAGEEAVVSYIIFE